LAAIIERDSFCAEEVDIFNLVRDWHELNLLKNEPKPQLISKIRLPLMQMNELLNDVRGSTLVNADSILDAIKMKHESQDHELCYRGVLCEF
jgi:BTB/POZ domain-containing protein 9